MAAILSQYSTTGFYHAPVSKGILGCMFLASCALNVPLAAHVKQYVIYNMSSVFEKYEIWRIFTSKIAFLDTKDFVCGCLLIYYFRIFERRYGSHKFASYLLATSTVTTVLELFTIYCLRQVDIRIMYLPSGPFSLILPLFVNYFMDIPRVTHTYVMEIPVTGKTLTYLLGLQVISTNKSSLLCGLCCLVSGVLCRWNVFHVVNVIKIPKFLSRAAKVTLGVFLDSAPPREGMVPMGATIEIQRQQRIEIMEQHMAMSRIQGNGDVGNANYRQQMAQGYSERLVPPNFDRGANIFGNFRAEGLWENLGLRERRASYGGNAEQGPSVNFNQNNVVQPQEEQIKALVEMGFARENVIEALRSCNNDVTIATAILLNER